MAAEAGIPLTISSDAHRPGLVFGSVTEATFLTPLRTAETMMIARTMTVSYTHLDVYKRQHLKAARMATSVFPKPTSPQIRRSMGRVDSMSAFVWAMARSLSLIHI